MTVLQQLLMNTRNDAVVAFLLLMAAAAAVVVVIVVLLLLKADEGPATLQSLAQVIQTNAATGRDDEQQTANERTQNHRRNDGRLEASVFIRCVAAVVETIAPIDGRNAPSVETEKRISLGTAIATTTTTTAIDFVRAISAMS